MSTNEEMIGRAEIDDLEAILAISAADVDESIRAVKDNADAIFTWDYEKGRRPALNKLYEKAKHAQWNGETDLDWSITYDREAQALEMVSQRTSGIAERHIDLTGTGLEAWGREQWIQFGMEMQNWSLSQFLHGEQGALICTAKIVETVPWIDAKYYASTQVMDEARHVEVFAKYLDTKLNGHYPINTHLKMLLDDIINDSRWDMTYLGMQIMVEGLALAAFGFMHQLTEEPLLKKLLRYVMSDEARHVAFGVLSLKEVYDELTDAELKERQEFSYEASVRMRDRFMSQEVWERLGVDVKQAIKVFDVIDADEDPFQQLLFSKIVPNCSKLGLLDANGGWLRKRFDTLGVRPSIAHDLAITTSSPGTRLREHPELVLDRLAWSKVYRRSFWDAHGFAFPAMYFEDYPVSIAAHLAAAKVATGLEVGYYWRQRDGGEASITQRSAEIGHVTDRFDSAGRVLDLVEPLGGDCWQVTVHYGFKNDPDLPGALALMRGRGCELESMTTSYFLSRDVVIPTIGSGMAPWREKLFAQMHHNASGAASFLNLPSNSVVELGSKIEI